MELQFKLLVMTAVWTIVALPVRQQEEIVGDGRISDIVRDYLNSRNFASKCKKANKYVVADDPDDFIQLWPITTTTTVKPTCCPKNTNIILLPMLNVVSEPKDAARVLKALGAADAPTVYADGKFDIKRNRDQLMSLFSLPLFNRCCNQKPETEVLTVNDEPEHMCTTPTRCKHERAVADPAEPGQMSKVPKYRRDINSTNQTQPNLSIFPPNSALFLDIFTPKGKDCDIADDSKDCSYDAEDSKRMMKLVIYVKKDQSPVTFTKALELCSKRGMMLPVIRDQLDFNDLITEVDDGRAYWIGLGKSECPRDACAYQWVDGVKDTRFIQRLVDLKQLRPKTGPMEFCAIRLTKRKTHIAIRCYSDGNSTAYYVCTHNPPSTGHENNN